MEEEVTQKTIALSFKAARFTEQALKSAVSAYLRHRSGAKNAAVKESHGRVSVRELMGSGEGAKSLALQEGKLKDFERAARKYNIDFAVKKDPSEKPPKYIVFFKGKDTDAITQAFKDFVHANEKRQQREPISARLQRAKELVMKLSPKQHDRNRDRSKEQGL